MYALLLSLGVIVSAAGLGAIAFGIPIQEFGLGNTMIIAGATGVVGGLGLIGLAAVLRELRHIARALSAKAEIGGEAAEARLAAPSVRPEPAARIAERPRPVAPAPARSAEPARTEPAAEETELTTPSPRPPLWPGRRPPGRGAPQGEPEPRLEPEPPPRPAELPRPTAPTPARARPEPARLDVAPEPSPERRRMFDTVWPRRGKKEADTAPAPREEPALDSGPIAEPSAERPAAPPAPEPVSILKSGVIDGMAYTLYTDGSIEAQLAQGTVRFASIEDLRIHLEQHE